MGVLTSDSEHLPKKILKQDHWDVVKDRISNLPDDILHLSQRWRNLWHFSRGNFNFDATKAVENIIVERGLDAYPVLLSKERPKYITWVDQVLNSHQGPTIYELRICFDLSNDSKNYIDKWICIAFQKRVENLELDFCYTVDYTFPAPEECFSCNPAAAQSCLSGMKFLTSLCLKHIRITDEVLGSLFSNCALLETLHLSDSTLFTKLQVSSFSTRLKHLHIIYCEDLKSIEVYASNLVSFEYVGPRIPLHIRHTPQVRHILYGDRLRKQHITYGLNRLSSCLSQLVTLKLSLNLHQGKFRLPNKLPEWTSLQCLTFEILAPDGKRLLDLTSMIEAAPSLRIFKLQLFIVGIKAREKVPEVNEYPNHQHLKEVEIIGYGGGLYDTKLVIYLLESAVALDKIVINPRSPAVVERPFQFKDGKKERRATKAALQLKKERPIRAEFVVI